MSSLRSLAPLLACILLAACGAKSTAPAAGAVDAQRVAEAEREVDPAVKLGDRASMLSLAQAVEAQGVREGAGARAVDFHRLAARLIERVWRVEGREQDAREAVDLYRAAARDLAITGACEAALRGAELNGELARDASVTYADLYRLQRRMAAVQSSAAGAPDAAAPPSAPGSPCSKTLEDSLAFLGPFRPPARVLESIDQGLAGEGALAAAAAGLPPGDAGSLLGDVPRIVRIESWPGKEAARVVVVVSRPARFRPGDEPPLAGRGPRTYVDIDGVDLGQALRDVRMAGIVTRVTSSATATGSRVTLELDGQAFRRVFYLPEPYRVVIDIARHPPSASLARGARSVSRLVLDPGHGGSDPGATGPAGIKEKDVTLDVAHRVAPVLAKEGVQVVLTRDDDRSVTLEERTARANGFAADLFVSIHCNAAESHARHGVETYVLDTTKDEIADRVAARENATSQAATREIASILANMRMADQASRSTRLAELIQRAAVASLHDKYPDVLDGGVKTAGFYVLVGARMPSVLFETSYISNPTEEQRLGTDDYRQRLADAVVNAVRAYREGR